MSSSIDLQTHTCISDGDLSPIELLEYASECGVRTISITDHDTLDAYTDELLAAADQKNMRMIMGVEISTITNKGKRYHILGYGHELRREPLVSRLKKLKRDRANVAHAMCESLRSYGWLMNEQLFSGNIAVTKTHIARSVLEHADNKEKLMKEWMGEIPSNGAFVEKWLIPGKPCFVPMTDPLDPYDAIDLIHQAKGVAILAHPSEYVLKGDDLEELVPRMIEMGIDGVEAISIVFDRSHGDILTEHRKMLTSMAYTHSLLITGGSDFHSSNPARFGSFIDLGFRNHEWSIEETIVDSLIAAMDDAKTM